MDFEHSPRTRQLQRQVRAFVDEHVAPAESTYAEQMRASGDPHLYPPVLDELKGQAREQGLWNLFLTVTGDGAGLSNVEYAPLAEIMGRSLNAPEAFNCSAPDTGNMEILALFATDDQRKRWLQPLLDGTARSTFSMTEPAVASSDATNLETTIRRDGSGYVVSGRKWFSSGALNPRCAMLIVMGRTSREGSRHQQHGMVIVPPDTPGVRIVRSTPIFGYEYRGGHCEIEYDDVRVPAENLIGAEGQGFAIAQARLGPGRVHHAMRLIGMAELALELLVARAADRTTFGVPVVQRDTLRQWVAEARIDIDQCRLAVLRTAWAIDAHGSKGAYRDIAMIKVSVPRMATTIINRAMQVHGAAGFTPDFPLAEMWVNARSIQMGDGPDEVHLASLARTELARAGRPEAR